MTRYVAIQLSDDELKALSMQCLNNANSRTKQGKSEAAVLWHSLAERLANAAGTTPESILFDEE